MASPPGSIAATTERLVVDWHTGMAIGGYDPVAFFTDGRPMAGNANFELRYAGAIWRFRNVGNRDAFAAQPDIYMPKFGGYDPIGVTRGVAAQVTPMFGSSPANGSTCSTIAAGWKSSPVTPTV